MRIFAIYHTIRLVAELNNSAPGQIQRGAVKKVPRAQRMHMNGILHGIPGNKLPPSSSSADAHTYCEEMKQINSTKDKHSFRKRDQYSEYVEARARFSKMHSVN